MEGSDAVIVKVLIGFLILSCFVNLFALFTSFNSYSLLGIFGFLILGYGAFGLWKRWTQPTIFLIGFITYVLVGNLLQLISYYSMWGMLIAVVVHSLLYGTILYFLTKPSMRSAYDLDWESIQKAMMVGAVIAVLVKLV